MLSSSFVSVSPAYLHPWLEHPTTLIIDLRPHAAFSSSRLPQALCLSVPSTLLKRPLFSLERLSAMIPSSNARSRFSAWSQASHIIVYDADATAIPESSNIYGLLRKFKNDGFDGELAWLQGGFQAVWRERRDLIDTEPPSSDTEDDDEDTPLTSSPPVLRTRHLSSSAFSLASTTVSAPKHHTAIPSIRPATTPDTVASVSRPAFNPFFDTIRQNTELSHGITERITLRLPRRVRKRINDLPFRWLQDIARRAAPTHSPSASDSSSDEEADLADPADIEEGTEALAMQFYRIELAEQRRLMGVMEHHSKESGAFEADGITQASLTFPFSITAGVEKGAKNRYRHIWPFEHARVRLHQKPHSDDDGYVNASYVQPLGTNKRYIATQGPLPATFTDFWTLCWEQNVHVIVMLTREIEGAMVKCGSYWIDSTYGPLRLRLLATAGAKEDAPVIYGADELFAPPREAKRASHRNQTQTVKRTFELTHTGYPAAKPRKVVHLQYLEWPDMNVPDDPRGVLGLIKEVEQAVAATAGEDGGEWLTSSDETVVPAKFSSLTGTEAGGQSPVLLHCSAGVGRTGGFIAVDAVLDAVRREMRKKSDGKMGVNPESVIVGDPTLGTGLVVPIPMSAGKSHPDEARKEDEGMVVHVPLAGYRPRGDPMKTPMQGDSESEHERESWLWSKEASVPSTRKWAESVLDSTGTRPAPPESASQSPSTASGSSSVDSSEDSSSFSFGRAGHRRGGTRHTESIATSVSGSSPHLKSFSQDASLSADPTHGEPLSTSWDHRTRTFSAPVRMGHKYFAGDARETIGASELADSSTTRLAEHNKAVPTSPLAKGSTLGGTSVNTRKASDSLSAPPGSVSPSAAGGSRCGHPTSPPTSPPRSQGAAGRSVAGGFRATTVDYKEPRPLHGDTSPAALTTYEEPIWQVVQDMREQRMSLCQSLRQYVFVHAAVIEGALVVVDEERERLREGEKGREAPGRRRKEKIKGKHVAGSERASAPAHNNSSSGSSMGKRGASPTELLRKDKTGEVSLSKRPSVKRTQQGRKEGSQMSPFGPGVTNR